IYNEKIRDLLRSGQEQQLRLEVRANPKYGNFVYGLKEVPVMDWQNLKQWLDFGVKARAVANTSMNATSSRSHCIFSMEVVHKMRSGGARTQLRSKLNLVDLAGSERQKKTQATGTRLKEGAMINQSLSNLALVISRLAEFANLSEKNKEKKAMEYAPFRSSKLTFLLEDSLRGNSKTVMIAALSPAEFNYEETLSTLLFAQSVKAVKTNAKKNENLEDNLIQDLEAECERLRQLVNMDAGNSQLQELAALEEMQRKYGRDFEEQLKLAEDLQKQRETLLADAGLTAK
ncbi:kif1, partial [Symbiodinium necroappetens]